MSETTFSGHDLVILTRFAKNIVSDRVRSRVFDSLSDSYGFYIGEQERLEQLYELNKEVGRLYLAGTPDKNEDVSNIIKQLDEDYICAIRIAVNTVYGFMRREFDEEYHYAFSNNDMEEGQLINDTRFAIESVLNTGAARFIRSIERFKMTLPGE